MNTNENLESGKIHGGNLVLLASEVFKRLAGMRMKFSVRSSGQRSSRALLILSSSVTAVNSLLEICISL